MQKFSFHSHTNSFGIFDGQSSTEEMIKKAEEIGYTELGISNHLVYHPNIEIKHPMFFNDYQKAEDSFRRNVDDIREKAANSKIKVHVGFEVDFFSSAAWRDAFEKLQKSLNADYYIGSTHFLRNKDESKVFNLYTLNQYDPAPSDDQLNEYFKDYWDNIVLAIESGYFTFIAHLDVCKLFSRFANIPCDEGKMRVIEALAKYNQPYELNTSGWTKVNEQHPSDWILQELQKRNVPIVINDDAHNVNSLGQHYEKAEELLKKLNYTNRWKFNNIKQAA